MSQVLIFSNQNEWATYRKHSWISYFTPPGPLQCKHCLGNLSSPKENLSIAFHMWKVWVMGSALDGRHAFGSSFVDKVERLVVDVYSGGKM